MKCGDFADRHLGEHAIRSAKRGRSWSAGASPQGIARGAERSPAAVGASGGRSAGGRGKGIGGGRKWQRGGGRIYKLEKFF
jgi:hypothetical protein